MQANETLPLDFQRNQAMGNNLMSGTEESGSKLGLFDGVASSEMQPDSDVVTSQNHFDSSSAEEDSE